MREYSKETIEALDGSIEKWFDITFRGARDGGHEDCPLCDLFNSPGVGSTCIGCPIRDDTKCIHCHGTPYESFTELFRFGESKKVYSSPSAQAAHDFYVWLKELRERVCEKKEEEVTYRRGDLFKGQLSGCIYMLAGTYSSMALVRVYSPFRPFDHRGDSASRPCAVEDTLNITEAEFKEIVGSACIDKVEGKLVFTEGGNESCD